MNVLVLGGTRFFGKHAVRALLAKGHTVTIATRGRAADPFGDAVHRLTLERTDPESLRQVLGGRHYDAVVDDLAYCSNDVKYLLDVLSCDRYVMTSSTAVYHKHMDTKEEEFDPQGHPLIWSSRGEFPYEEGKRQAEAALVQKYPHVAAAAVRFPFVIGEDDYTNRLYFYVEHIVNGRAMQVDNPECPMAFVRSDEAGAFLAFMAESGFCGAVNGSSEQVLSIRDIADYVAQKTGCTPVLSAEGDTAPYNGENAYSIHVGRAKELGYAFTPLKDWIYDLLDYYIERAKN